MRAVILSEPRGFDPGAVAKAVAAVQNIPFTDATQKARRQWGIVAENVEEAAVERWLQALGNAGVKALAVDPERLSPPPAPLGVQKLTLAEDQIVLTLKSGEPAAAGKEAVGLIAAAAFYEDTTTKSIRQEGPSAAQRLASAGLMMATGLPISIGPKKKTVEKTEHHSDLQLVLDLIRWDRSARWRIDGRQLDYSFLGTKKQYSAQLNFRQLVLALRECLAKAWSNRGADYLASNKPLAEFGYQSLADLDQETRWLLTLQNL